MKIFISRSRLVERIDFNLSEVDTDVFNLMYDHYEQGDKREELLLHDIYNRLTDIQELFEIYKEEVERNGSK